MRKLLFCLSICLCPLRIFSNEQSVDLRTFLKTRTQQYPFAQETKIYLSTPPRTGSTLVYNVLRFLFEPENHNNWEMNASNLITKNHETNLVPKDGLFVFTMRNPVEACMSHYRVCCSDQNAILPLKILDEILKMQVNSLRYLNKLISKNKKVLVLKYESFVDNFDSLFESIENSFRINISLTDKDIIKSALNKENVSKHIEGFSSFSQYDELSLFHGLHINHGEFSEEFEAIVRADIISRIQPYIREFKKWGYFIEER